VELDSVNLKPSCVPSDLPVRLLAGRIDRIKLEISLLRILFQPVRLTASGATVILTTSAVETPPELALEQLAEASLGAVRQALRASDDIGGGRLLQGLVGRVLSRLVCNVECVCTTRYIWSYYRMCALCLLSCVLVCASG
jgi:hypothetical protein